MYSRDMQGSGIRDQRSGGMPHQPSSEPHRPPPEHRPPEHRPPEPPAGTGSGRPYPPARPPQNPRPPGHPAQGHRPPEPHLPPQDPHPHPPEAHPHPPEPPRPPCHRPQKPPGLGNLLGNLQKGDLLMLAILYLILSEDEDDAMLPLIAIGLYLILK